MKIYKTIVDVEPSAEPLTLSEVQTHLRVSGEIDLLDSLIKVARRNIERYLNRALITTSYTGYADKWNREFYLPYAPLQTVESIQYYNTNGLLTTLAASNYYVSVQEEPGEIKFVYDFVGPELQEGRPNAIEIEFTSGYGDSGEEVPEDIKHAMKLLITNYYEHRGDIVVGASVGRIPNYITDLIHSYKLYNF